MVTNKARAARPSFMDGLRYTLFLATYLLALSLNAQQRERLVWYDPSTAPFHAIHNQLWGECDFASRYDRLPAKAQRIVREEVWHLSKSAAGLKLVFDTDASAITVRYVVSRKRYAKDHFPATGVSGVDLFTFDADGKWAWVNGTYDFKDTITYTFLDLGFDGGVTTGIRNYHLYLPLFNAVEWLEIGVSPNHSFRFVPPSEEKPIVVYGTSIAQGACASRAGMAWTNLLERAMHAPVVNLGFAGNGRLDQEVVDLLVESEARIFVLDCLPNLGRAAIRSKIDYAVSAIRSRHPHTPIILSEHSGYLERGASPRRASGIRAINEESWNEYRALEAHGVTGLYYLRNEDFGLDFNDSVDGIHPTDGGMLKYAKAYEKLVKAIWNNENVSGLDSK